MRVGNVAFGVRGLALAFQNAWKALGLLDPRRPYWKAAASRRTPKRAE